MPNSKFKCSGCGQYRSVELRMRFGPYKVCCHGCLERAQENARRKSASKTKKRAHPELTPNFLRSIRKRDGNVCRWCGKTSALQVHHIDYRSERGSDEAHNLITLCQMHHEMAHGNKRLFKPLLKAYIWLLYVEGRRATIPQIGRWMGRKEKAS